MAYMAKTTVITDDLDGTGSAETVTFSVDGVSYEIDLAKKSRTAFDKALKPYIDAGRRVGRGRSTASAKPPGRRKDLAQVREWAKSNGYEISDRGRIPAEVVEAFDAK